MRNSTKRGKGAMVTAFRQTKEGLVDKEERSGLMKEKKS